VIVEVFGTVRPNGEELIDGFKGAVASQFYNGDAERVGCGIESVGVALRSWALRVEGGGDE
jgi:hypothetical protein